jgi:hypothetical protein
MYARAQQKLHKNEIMKNSKIMRHNYDYKKKVKKRSKRIDECLILFLYFYTYFRIIKIFYSIFIYLFFK